MRSQQQLAAVEELYARQEVLSSTLNRAAIQLEEGAAQRDTLKAELRRHRRLAKKLQKHLPASFGIPTPVVAPTCAGQDLLRQCFIDSSSGEQRAGTAPEIDEGGRSADLPTMVRGRTEHGSVALLRMGSFGPYRRLARAQVMLQTMRQILYKNCLGLLTEVLHAAKNYSRLPFP